MLEQSAAAEFCFACTISGDGPDLASLGIAIFGILISVISALVSWYAVNSSRSNHDALILREEFQPHRNVVDEALKVLRDKYAALELSVNPQLAWARTESNFSQEQTAIETAVLDIRNQATLIDGRKLFKVSWSPPIEKLVSKMERDWVILASDRHPIGIRRLAATDILAGIKDLISTSDSLVEKGVMAPLSRKKWL